MAREQGLDLVTASRKDHGRRSLIRPGSRAWPAIIREPGRIMRRRHVRSRTLSRRTRFPRHWLRVCAFGTCSRKKNEPLDLVHLPPARRSRWVADVRALRLERTRGSRRLSSRRRALRPSRHRCVSCASTRRIAGRASRTPGTSHGVANRRDQACLLHDALCPRCGAPAVHEADPCLGHSRWACRCNLGCRPPSGLPTVHIHGGADGVLVHRLTLLRATIALTDKSRPNSDEGRCRSGSSLIQSPCRPPRGFDASRSPPTGAGLRWAALLPANV